MSNANGSRSKYDDSKSLVEQPYAIAVHSISKLDDPRRHNPKNPGSASTGVKLSLFADMATGDWSWKPARNARFPQFEMPAFLGVPPSAAELYGRVSYRAQA